MNSKHILATAIAVLGILIWAPASLAGGPKQNAEQLFAIDHGVRASTDLRANQIPPEGGGGGVCWGRELERGAGGWPYGRRLYLYTVWCGHGGLITYRWSSVRTSHDFMCWNNGGPYLAKTAGGAGWTYVQVQAWVDVACHSPWWFDWHDSLMMRVNYYPNGAYATVAWD